MRTKAVKALVVALALSVFVTSVTAQQSGQAGQATQAPKGFELKGKAPVNREPLKVKLPKAQQAQLANGLRVLVIESHKFPRFWMNLVIESGAMSEPADRRGLASFTALLLGEGTRRRSSRDIAEQIASLGSQLYITPDPTQPFTPLIATGLIENLDQTLDIFSDMIVSPAFKQEEVEKFKARQAAQLQNLRTNPGSLSLEMLYRTIYGNHPAAVINPPAESVKGLTSTDLAKFHSAHYRPNNGFLVVCGDVTMKEILPKIEKYFGKWDRAVIETAAVPAVNLAGESRIHLVNRPGSVQTLLMLGNLAIERASDDYIAMQVMNEILGRGAGRLLRNLREEKGYTYGAYSELRLAKHPGVIIAYAQVKNDVTGAALKEFLYEIKRMRDEKVLPVELENAKRTITGQFALSLESPSALVSNVITQRVFNLPANYWDTYPQLIASVTAEDVQRVAKKYLDPASLQIVAIGDAAKVRDMLLKFGAVELYDVEGKREQPESRSDNR
jgi:predicted Zn-dependent peptidase